jgi:hypothetical protein
MPTPPPAPLPEAQSLVLPGLGAAIAPAMELMAVPKKKVPSLPPQSTLLYPFRLHSRALVLVITAVAVR